jgi:hypothetical protein
MRIRLLIVASSLVLLVTACAPSAGSSTGITAVDYRRTGGFIGLDDHLSIDANGQAQLTRRTTRTTFIVPADQFRQLGTTFASANFTSLHAEYIPAPGGADQTVYVVTYNGQMVRTADSAVPAALRPVLDLLNQIIETNGK